MTRRSLLKWLGNLALLGAPFASRLAGALTEGRPIEYLLLHDPDAGDYRPFLRHVGVNPTLVTKWDIRKDHARVRAFLARFSRNTKVFSYPVLLVRPESDARDIEYWDSAWVRAHRANFEDACYPISGSWWSVEGDWNPTKEKVEEHLFLSPNHASGKFQGEWLSLLRFEELQSVHSDHHREMIHEGKVTWASVNKECPAI